LNFALFGDEVRSRAFFNDNYFFGFFLSYFQSGRDFLHLADKLITAARNRDNKFFVFLKAAERFSAESEYFAKGSFPRQKCPPKLH
jgi:hypothetical protein